MNEAPKIAKVAFIKVKTSFELTTAPTTIVMCGRESAVPQVAKNTTLLDDE